MPETVRDWPVYAEITPNTRATIKSLSEGVQNEVSKTIQHGFTLLPDVTDISLEWDHSWLPITDWEQIRVKPSKSGCLDITDYWDEKLAYYE